MKNVNNDFYVLLDQIIKQLQEIQEGQKEDIKHGAKIVKATTYGTITVTNKTRKGYTKADQEKIDKFCLENDIEKIITCNYKEVTATASTTAKNLARKQVNNILEDIAENGAINVAKVASAILEASK